MPSKVLITGICGFVGSSLALELKRHSDQIEILGIDNLSRPGSEQNRHIFRKHGIRLIHGDIRLPSDLERLPRFDWVIDAAANPSVLAGITGETSSRQLMEHNLVGTLNLLEFCRQTGSGVVMLSTSRVYSLSALCALPVAVQDHAYVPSFSEIHVPGVSWKGVTEEFSTRPPLSLYGSAKLASELLILEYGLSFKFPVFVNRCGVLAGAGQFGKADQGIFSYWIHSFVGRRPLRYIGFDGKGCQVRDCLHPRDLAALVIRQLSTPEKAGEVLNISGGAANGMSLAQLTRWCTARFGPHHIAADPQPRPFDVPWLILDSSRAVERWNWRPTVKLETILEEIAAHAEAHPNWLDLSAA